MAPPSLAGKRVLLLLRQVALKEFGQPLSVRGMQKKAAEFIGLERSLASHLVSGGRVNIGLQTLQGITEKMRLRSEFFSIKSIDEPNYEDFIERRPGPGIAEPRAIQQNINSSDLDSLLTDLNSTEAEKSAVAELFRRHPELPIVSYTVQATIFALRATRNLNTAIDTGINASLDNELKRSGRRPDDEPPPSPRPRRG